MSDSRDDRFQNPIVEGAKEGLAEFAAGSLKWTLGGALAGALVLGGLGLWKFGLTGFAIGALAGGVGAWWFYLQI